MSLREAETCEASIGVEMKRGPVAILCRATPIKFYRGGLPFPIALCEEHATYLIEKGRIDARPVKN
jgi:hypothetical protein